MNAYGGRFRVKLIHRGDNCRDMCAEADCRTAQKEERLKENGHPGRDPS